METARGMAALRIPPKNETPASVTVVRKLPHISPLPLLRRRGVAIRFGSWPPAHPQTSGLTFGRKQRITVIMAFTATKPGINRGIGYSRLQATGILSINFFPGKARRAICPGLPA